LIFSVEFAIVDTETKRNEKKQGEAKVELDSKVEARSVRRESSRILFVKDGKQSEPRDL
jgi:hypothetical protein